MSAFLCSDRHTLLVATAMVDHQVVSGDPIQVATQLRDANNKALAARYGDKPVPLGPVGSLDVDASDARLVHKQASCLRYQCCEGDVLETHPTMPPLQKLIDSLGVTDAQWRDSDPWAIA